MGKRRAAIDENRLLGPNMADRMTAGLPLRLRMTVGRMGKVVGNIRIHVTGRHDMAAKLGEAVGAGGDVAPHRHFRHVQKRCRFLEMNGPAHRENLLESIDSILFAACHRELSAEGGAVCGSPEEIVMIITTCHAAATTPSADPPVLIIKTTEEPGKAKSPMREEVHRAFKLCWQWEEDIASNNELRWEEECAGSLKMKIHHRRSKNRHFIAMQQCNNARLTRENSVFRSASRLACSCSQRRNRAACRRTGSQGKIR